MTQREELAKALAAVVGWEGVSWKEEEVTACARDAWGLHRAYGPQGDRLRLPELVVRPRSTEEVAAVVRLAAQREIPIVPYGGGTGVMGGACTVAPGIVVDLRAMNRILAIDKEGRLARVEAGVILSDLERELNRQGLILGHDPWSLPIATVGGAIATNGLGYRASRYGSMGDQVLGLVVVLPDGSVLTTRAVPKSSTGPDLKHLFIGAEGVLGIITEATLRVFPLPEERILRAYTFPSFEAGFAAIQEMFAIGLKPALLDYGENRVPLFLRPLSWLLHLHTEEPTLYLAFEGFREEVEAQDGRARTICLAHGGRDLGQEEAREFWETRHRAGEIYARYRSWWRRRFLAWRLLRNLGLEYIDVALPASQVLAYRERCRALLARRGVHVLEWGLWTQPELLNVVMLKLSLIPRNTRDGLAEALDEALRLAQAMGGSMEYCHGVGLRLAHLMEEEHGRGLELLRQIKRALDPKNIMNPGKMGL